MNLNEAVRESKRHVGFSGELSLMDSSVSYKTLQILLHRFGWLTKNGSGKVWKHIFFSPSVYLSANLLLLMLVTVPSAHFPFTLSVRWRNGVRVGTEGGKEAADLNSHQSWSFFPLTKCRFLVGSLNSRAGITATPLLEWIHRLLRVNIKKSSGR